MINPSVINVFQIVGYIGVGAMVAFLIFLYPVRIITYLIYDVVKHLRKISPISKRGRERGKE